MAWNHRTAVVAMGIAIQSAAGVFEEPAAPDDLVGVSVPNNAYEVITADDPTATGAVWRAKPIYLGKTGTAGATIPLRGPGGASPPDANEWPVGRILQAAGFTEVRNATAITDTSAGGTTSSITLEAGSNAADDFYLGYPIQHANFGEAGFRATTMVQDYDGTTKVATIPETVTAPATGDYTIPPFLAYVLGTMTTVPPLLSVSIWRDKKRYDYLDWRPTSLSIDVPVTNDANQVFPSIDFSGRATPHQVVDEDAPTLPSSILNVPVPPARGGKFVLDRVKLGHQSIRFALNVDTAAPSNQNKDQGQDGYEITSGTRQISLDLNQMNVTDLDIDARVDNQTVLPILSTWGLGAGNRWGLLLPNNCLQAHSPGDRNGFVNLTGDAAPVDVDKSASLAVWW